MRFERKAEGLLFEGRKRKSILVNLDEAKLLVKKIIQDILEEKIEISDEVQLIGGESLLDSLKLVEVCLALEDAADDNGFEFDWTSEATMSKYRSMFRTVTSLAEEFVNQSSEQT